MGKFASMLLCRLRKLIRLVGQLGSESNTERNDPDKLRNELLELELSYELGEIEQGEYEDAHRVLTDRLQRARRTNGNR